MVVENLMGARGSQSGRLPRVPELGALGGIGRGHMVMGLDDE